MTDYRYTGNRALVRTDGEDIAPGERFDPTESELRHFGNHIEVIESDDDELEPIAEEEPALPYDEDDHWRTVVSAIKTGAYDDSLDLIASEDDRQSIVEAAQDRQETINE